MAPSKGLAKASLEVAVESVDVIVEEQTLDIGGLPVRYLTAGEGPPLVLLHALARVL